MSAKPNCAFLSALAEAGIFYKPFYLFRWSCHVARSLACMGEVYHLRNTVCLRPRWGTVDRSLVRVTDEVFVLARVSPSPVVVPARMDFTFDCIAADSRVSFVIADGRLCR